MLGAWKDRLSVDLAVTLRDLFAVEHEPVAEVPPRRELGDLAFPAALHLARTLRRKPREIAEEIAAAWQLPDGVRELRVEGPGYLNLFFDRPAFAARLLSAPVLGEPSTHGGKVVLEHTNINPNKAAHIGHLRNAVLGDVLARCLRAIGREVEIQNYIDDTGVQVADVVVGFVDLEHRTVAEVAAIPEPFDYHCWELYARVGRWYEEDPARDAVRRETLHALERGEGERAEMGRLVARRIVGRHLTTMQRLGIGYDLLTHESDILGLDFFDDAFEKLRQSGAIQLEEDGKNAGCWVMPLSETAEFAGLEDPDTVIVRSDGTITYVGKDIAYQLWKFGLLGRDFGYRWWKERGLWTTTTDGAEDHPAFGGGEQVINVIDARQSYLQKIVRAGLSALGHDQEADRSRHFAYEMVTLSAATARLLGVDAEDGKGVEMSGRKGVGVKADDLLDRLEQKAREEIQTRNRELEHDELGLLARKIATAALRFFMVKATTTRVLAFDFAEALSFEGDSGPYLQYSLVRAKNIGRRLAEAGRETSISADEVAGLEPGLWSDDLWDMVHAVARTDEAVEKAATTLELSLVARHALELAQRFHALYHHHPVLHEDDRGLRSARLATFEIFARGLRATAELLGLPEPDRM
jgi:arginyl-tRNA synthetase